MTNEETIKNLKKLKSFHNGSYGTAIAEAIKALEQTRWIPVSERLPEESGDYHVTIKWKGKFSGNFYKEADVIEYDKKTKKWNCGDGDVIAWMPLSEPYKAESEEDE